MDNKDKTNLIVVGHSRTPSTTEIAEIAANKTNKWVVVNSTDDVEEPKQKVSTTDPFLNYMPYVASPLTQLGQLNNTTKADLKRCKKGIHTYEDNECIHCRKTIN